jgi:hypothetical protein
MYTYQHMACPSSKARFYGYVELQIKDLVPEHDYLDSPAQRISILYSAS